MDTAEQITTTRARLENLAAKEQERQEQLRRFREPFAADMEATQAELERLERLERDETARTQLRGLAAGTRMHTTALETAVFEGNRQLKRTLEAMEHHLEGIRTNRKRFYETLETLAPNVTKEKAPLGPASQEEHAHARQVISDLQKAKLDLDAVMSSSTGVLSPFDTWKALPTAELGADLWQVFLETKQPKNPGALARPLKKIR
jgi:chromosome segregation ATPase